MKRRGFLALTAVLSAGCTLPVIPKRPAPALDDALGWVRLEQDSGRYTLFLPRVEMGQNIATGLKQIACEELGVGWDRLDLRLPSTADIARVRATVGSASVQDYALLLAQACASLREAVDAGRKTGRVEALPRPMSELRAFSGEKRRYVGRAMPLAQGDSIVRGRPLYVADTQRPGMLFGRVLRAPAAPELASQAVALNEAAARALPGFVALLRDEPLLTQGSSRGIGIVARTPGSLDRIAAALDVQWQIEGSFEQVDIDAALDIDHRLQGGALSHRLLKDSVDTTAPWDVDLRIDIPLAAHNPIEPRAAVAEMAASGDAMRLWVGSQDVFYQRDVVARRLGLDAEKVIVQGCRVGGGFGGKTLCTVELEAAVLARAVKGRPVKVQWSRAQELQLGFHRPPSSHRLRVRLHEGRIQDWWHAFASSHIFFTNAGIPAWMQRFTNLVGDDGVARGALPPYRALRHARVEFDLQRLPVYTGPWRGLGAGPNNWVIECAIDECARRLGADPVQFRLRHIEDKRLARVLARAAVESGPPVSSGNSVRRGRGIACGIYKGMSYAAVVADVEVAPDGSLRVTRLLCAHDCGTVINPDQVPAQCEGNLVWGLGMVISDGLPVAGGRVAASTFADAPIPRLDQVPAMQVLLVDEGGEAPSGAGETAIVAAAAAIANAVRDATGRRITRFPLRPEDLRTSAAR